MTGKDEVLQKYRKIDRECALLSKYQTEETEEERVFIPTDENMKKVWKKFESLKVSVENLEEPDAVFSMVKHHFGDFLESLEYIFRDKEKHPEMDYLGLHWEIENTSRLNRHPDEERCAGLVQRIKELCDASEIVLDLIKKKTEKEERIGVAEELWKESRMIENYMIDLKTYFPTFSEGQNKQMDKALASARDILIWMAEELGGEFQYELEKEEEDLSRSVKMEEKVYRDLLRKQLGVSLDELLSWYEDEIEKTRQEVFDIADKLDVPEETPKTMQEINELLFRYEGPCDSPEEMLDRAEEYLKRTRKLAHEYVRLPEDEICRCVAVPFCCKDSYPWGGYEGGDFSVRPLIGQMFLNVYNYRNVTDGWIKLNALHEAYPGHHVQYVRAAIDETPETVKIGAKLVPLLEGTCLRTERAFEDLFSEDPFFPLFVAYRRHHASVRICADLKLFYYGSSLEEVIQLYEKELGFDRVTARGQVRAHQNSPGYFTCYYYGMKKICEWEKEYGFSKKEFTELLFSAGYISIERFEELVKMEEDERQRYYHEFSSLMNIEK